MRVLYDWYEISYVRYSLPEHCTVNGRIFPKLAIHLVASDIF